VGKVGKGEREGEEEEGRMSRDKGERSGVEEER